MNNSIPQGHYKPAVRYGNIVFSAGMTPRKDGVLLMSGKIETNIPTGGSQKCIDGSHGVKYSLIISLRYDLADEVGFSW